MTHALLKQWAKYLPIVGALQESGYANSAVESRCSKAKLYWSSQVNELLENIFSCLDKEVRSLPSKFTKVSCQRNKSSVNG